ncbi:unnamed protein product [Brassicogethes aeneus]|uniref:Uncharacterized protein n=1 Tax=Brassicogethes aeneus TaxID=1431903 RepID=A0A9P0AW63_BRAAE|nr:unnamed protein product [Brassicogethes aeneus]
MSLVQSSSVINVQNSFNGDVIQRANTIILCLREKTEELSKEKPKDASKAAKTTYQKLKTFFVLQANDIHETVEETKADVHTTEIKKERLGKMFDSMAKEIENQRQEAMDALEDMTPTQQDEYLIFWGHFLEFFTDLFAWLKKLVLDIVEGIKNGFKLIGTAIKGLFESIADFFKTVFST